MQITTPYNSNNQDKFQSNSNVNSLTSLQLNQYKDIAICVSGGADSMYLLNLIYQYFKQNTSTNIGISIALHILHVNHGINPESNKWEELVKTHVEKLNFDLSSGAGACANTTNNLMATVTATATAKPTIVLKFASTQLHLRLANQYSQSETLCRNLRWQWIEQYCLDNNVPVILTAHHKEDENENRFISIFRNRNGELNQPIVSINKQTKLIKIKPLLLPEFKTLTKQNIINHLNQINVQFVHDPSNDEQFCLRNVIRNGLFKGLKMLNPKENEHYLNAMDKFFNHYNKVNDFYNQFIQKETQQILQTVKPITNNNLIIQSRYTITVEPNWIGTDYIGDIIAKLFYEHHNKLPEPVPQVDIAPTSLPKQLKNNQIEMLDREIKETIMGNRKGTIVIQQSKSATKSNHSNLEKLPLVRVQVAKNKETPNKTFLYVFFTNE